MTQEILFYNSLTRKKEPFLPVNPPFVGMYVCGPTVYGDPHLGHARPYILFDLIYRYLTHLEFKVRYVRNITDVGHLEGDSDAGEDKIQKKARLEKLEPMEVVQYYTDRFHSAMDALNVKRPSIEPRASGHILEQIEMIKKIVSVGLAYEVNGSVYFDVNEYSQKNNYGKLSGRVLEDLLSHTRALEGSEEKRNPFDFALWKKASPHHLMHWPSPWGEGFPGWHLECSVMSTKYLGERFDIHGGGMDLLFPHHECEIAQSVAAMGHEPVRYWIHNNMITISGQKMAKSLNNFITLDEVFSGNNPLLAQAYSPVTVRFFILQAHYRSTVDFSNKALQSAEKGMQKLMEAFRLIPQLKSGVKSSVDINGLRQKCYDALNDDMNTAILLAHLFEGVRIINSVYAGHETLTAGDRDELKTVFNLFAFEILGLKEDTPAVQSEIVDRLMQVIITLRNNARKNKDFSTSDTIRNELEKIHVTLKDEKDGTRWSFIQETG